MKADNINHVVMDCKVVKKMWKLTHFIEEVQLFINEYLLGMI